MVELSIIIPVYNSEKYLSSCLSSICKQIKDKVEIIIINDGSTDKSIKICRDYIKKYENIKLINEKKNRGVSYSRNVGIKNCSGKYIFFFDSDDKLINNSIPRILENIRHFGQTEIFVLKNKIISYKKVDKNQFISPQQNKQKNILSSIKNFDKFRATCWNFIIQKKFMTLKKIKFKDIAVFEDQVFVSSLLCNAKKFKIIDKAIYLNRIYDPDTLSKKTGYIIVSSCTKILYEIIKIMHHHENLFNRKKINFLISRLRYASNQLFIHILICNNLEIKKISKYIHKNYSIFSKLIKYKSYNFYQIIKKKENIEKNLLGYKKEKISLLKKILSEIKSTKLIIFCAGSYSEVILKSLKKLNIKILTIVDNNYHYSGKKLNNIKIKNPSYLKKNFKRLSNHSFLVCNKNFLNFNKIKTQLCKMGFKNGNIIHIGV